MTRLPAMVLAVAPMLAATGAHGQTGSMALDAAGKVIQYNPPPALDGYISFAFVVGLDRKSYLSTIAPSGNKATMLRFDPADADQGIVDLGAPSDTETFSCEGSMTVGKDGVVYVGTYPGAKLVSYDPSTGRLADHGRMDDTQKYNADLATGRNGWIYNGVGVFSQQIVAYNPKTGERRGIVSEEDRGGAGYGLCYNGADGHAYGSIDDTHFRLVDGKGVEIAEGEMAERKTTPMADGRRLADAGIEDFVKQTCSYTLHDPNTGKAAAGQFRFQGAPAETFAIGEGPNGDAYGSTALPMEILKFSAADEKLTYLGHLGSGEAYSITSWRNKVYLCTYPGSALWLYDRDKPWNPGPYAERAPEYNPWYLIKKYWMGVGHVRPYAMILGPGDKLYVGSGADYGTIGGAMAVFDPATDTYVKNYREPFEEHGVASLAYDPRSGLVFGGSNGFFVWDQTKEAITLRLPIDRPDGMCVVGDRVFAIAGDMLYVFDIPSQKVVLEAKNPFGSPRRMSLAQHADGLIYGLTETSIITIDPETCELKELARAPEAINCGWALNDTGVHFCTGTNLWHYKLASAQFEDLGVCAVTANLYASMVGPDEKGENTRLYFLFKTGEGLFITQVDPGQG